jgi:hypothetical protein
LPRVLGGHSAKNNLSSAYGGALGKLVFFKIN